MALKLADLRLVDDLIEECRKNQGEHIPAGHPRTSWATKYSHWFVEAVTKLYALYSRRGYDDPERAVLAALQAAGIHSCRGGVMTPPQLRYLVEAYDVVSLAKAIKQI